MKILSLPTYCKPEHGASPYIGQNRNQAYADQGWEMVTFAPTPCRGIDAATRKKYKGKDYRVEKDFDGHRTIYRFSMYAEGKNPVMRALRYFFISVKHLNRALFSKHAKGVDVMFLASTPPYQGLLGATVKKFRKIPFVYNLQDIFPDSLVGTGLAKKDGLLWKIGRRIENCTYRNADKIVVISQDFKRNIMAKGVPEEKIEVIYNWVDENAVIPVKDEDNELFEEFGISRDKFRVVYAGNLGNAQNIRIIVEAAKRLKDNNNIEFVIFGKGSLKNEINETKAKEQLDNLKIFPIQPYERVSKVYGLGHVCIVACKPGLGGAAMPSKTWSIMSSGRAVLANFDEGELKEILEGESALRPFDPAQGPQAQGPQQTQVPQVQGPQAAKPCGVFTKAGDLEGFVSAIEELSRHPEQCAEMGRNGRQFIMENLSREVGTQKYVAVIKSVVNVNGR